MPKLTDEQKRDNQVTRTYERYQTWTIGKCKNDALKEFQKVRRLQNARHQNGELVLQCICCNKVGRFEQFDAGHYLSRKFTAVAFSPNNCWPQLKYCNQYLSGNQAEYRKMLIGRIGIEEVLLLEAFRDAKVEYTAFQYAQMRECYRAMAKDLEKELGL